MQDKTLIFAQHDALNIIGKYENMKAKGFVRECSYLKNELDSPIF